MDLQEEYYQRNGVETPLIRFCAQTFLIIERSHSSLDKKYEIFHSTLINKEGIPGLFEIRIFPVHRSSRAEAKRFPTENKVNCNWDDYEEWLREWSHTQLKNKKAGVPFSDLRIALWEMFIVGQDHVFQEAMMPFPLVEKIAESLDCSKTVEERTSLIDGIVKLVNEHKPFGGFKPFLANWNQYIGQYLNANTYGNWIVSLMKSLK